MFILHIPNFDTFFIKHLIYYISLHDQGVEMVNWAEPFKLTEKHVSFLDWIVMLTNCQRLQKKSCYDMRPIIASWIFQRNEAWSTSVVLVLSDTEHNGNNGSCVQWLLECHWNRRQTFSHSIRWEERAQELEMEGYSGL